MRRPLVIGLATLVVVAAGTGAGIALFVQHEHKGLVAQSVRPCDGREKPVAGVPASLPLGLPATVGSTLLNVDTQGSTTVAFAKVDGGRGDIVKVRDRVLGDLEGAGYTVKGTDQEPGYEAEAELAGTHQGTLKVSPLCTGLLEVRYKIEQ